MKPDGQALCAQCRLLQEMSASCRGCGHDTVVSLGAPKAQLAAAGLLAERRGAVQIAKESKGQQTFLRGVLFPSLLVSGVLFLLVSIFINTRAAMGATICGLILLFMLGISAFDYDIFGFGYRLIWGRKLQFTAIDPQIVAAHRSSPVRRRGTARPFGPEQPTHLGSETDLASSLMIRPEGSRALYLRTVRSTDFLVHTAEGESYLVTGELLLEDAETDRQRVAAGEVRLLLATLQVPDHEMPAAEAEEIVLRSGDPVEVVGTPSAEARTECAGGFRDGGLIPTFRGTPGNPVMIRVLSA